MQDDPQQHGNGPQGVQVRSSGEGGVLPVLMESVRTTPFNIEPGRPGLTDEALRAWPHERTTDM